MPKSKSPSEQTTELRDGINEFQISQRAIKSRRQRINSTTAAATLKYHFNKLVTITLAVRFTMPPLNNFLTNEKGC